MRPFAQIVRAGPSCSAVIAVILWSVLSPAAPAQNENSGQAANREADVEPAVGNEVIVKSPSISLDDDGRHVPSSHQTRYVIDKKEGNRVHLVAPDKSRQGWVEGKQVVSASHAIDYFSGEIARNPQDSNAYWMRAQLWTSPRGDERALADYDQIIRLAPEHGPSYAARSAILLRKGRLDQALADCNRAIELDPKDAWNRVNRANVWTARKEYQHALDDLNEAILLNPAYAYAWGQRSRYWERENRFENAMKDIDEAIRLDPGGAIFRWCRGRLWADKQDHDKAIADFSEAIRVEPTDADYRILRGNSWSAQGMHTLAMADFDEAIRIRPDYAYGYFARGQERTKEKNYDLAIADYTRALQIDPSFLASYIGRADASRRKGEFAKAIADLMELIRLDPGELQGHRQLAWILATCPDEKFRDGKRAFEEAKRACALTKWKDPRCLDTLAAAYAETGDFEAAAKWSWAAAGQVDLSTSTGKRAMTLIMRRRAFYYLRKIPFRE